VVGIEGAVGDAQRRHRRRDPDEAVVIHEALTRPGTAREDVEAGVPSSFPLARRAGLGLSYTIAVRAKASPPKSRQESGMDYPHTPPAAVRWVWLPLLVLGSVAVADERRPPGDAKPAQALPAAVDPDHAAKMGRGLEVFKRHVKPVLVAQCVKCHSGDNAKSELDLSDRDGLLRGGTAGPAIVPGRGKESLLYQVVTHAKQPHMPLKAAKLPDDQAARLAAWIDLGAPYDAPLVADARKATNWTQAVVPPAAKQFWSFQPLRRTEPPQVRDAGWCRTPLDRFILARLEAAGLAPSPPLAKRQLLRRLSFDLVGLPPTPEELAAFENDPSPDASEKAVDRLLASPHYGERWARHWLDLARFAESHGFEHDYDRPSAYHYRDFVIKALNLDLPYDTFVKWQIAGDELEPENNLALTATGFLAAGVHPTQITKKEAARHRYDAIDDMLSTIGTAMLGLTVGCARCHDHKFDPIPQADYYRLLSTFTTTVRTEIDLYLDREGDRAAKARFDAEHAPLVAALTAFEKDHLPARRDALARQWEQDPARLQAAVVDTLTRRGPKWGALLHHLGTTDPEWRRLKQAVLDHEKKAPKPKTVKALIASEGLPAVRLHTQGDDFLKETHFLRRGDVEQKDGVAPQGYLQVLMNAPEGPAHWPARPPAGARTSFRRTALANWLTDTEAGAGHLLARVIVNRLWQHHFGRGIVATPSDFGTRGEPPTHPELLDYLATELIRGGWRLKPIHKLIVLSAAYQQGGARDEAELKIDPDNKLWWRVPPRRLEAEVIRDAMLAVSGLLDPTPFGPGTLDPGHRRRSIYFTVKRSKLVPMMTVFDSPEALTGMAERPATTIAPQALLLMNNPQVRTYAHGLARRAAGAAAGQEAALTAAYRLALARPPAVEEQADGLAFLRDQAESYKAAGKPDPEHLALTDLCHALLCSNEFVYVD
jgi:hypothetical protein